MVAQFPLRAVGNEHRIITLPKTIVVVKLLVFFRFVVELADRA